MLLPSRVEDFDGRLRLGLEAAGVGFTIARIHRPQLVVRFDGTVWIKYLQENFTAIARANPGKIRADLPALSIENVAHRTIIRVDLFPMSSVAGLFCQRQKLL